MTRPSHAAGARPALMPWAVIGIVEANDDPLELGRVRVSFPTLHPGPWSFWLRVASPMASSRSGFFAAPHLGDEVLVVFLHGHPDLGVVIGQLWNGVDKPPPEALGADPSAVSPDPPRRTDEREHRLVWRSRRGHLVLLDDAEGTASVQIRDRTRALSIRLDSETQTLHIDNAAGDVVISARRSLRLRSGADVEITAGAELSLESAQHTRHRVGGDYSLDTAGSATLRSGGTFEAQSTAASLRCMAATRTTIEGTSTVVLGRGDATLEGRLAARVVGGVVKIN